MADHGVDVSLVEVKGQGSKFDLVNAVWEKIVRKEISMVLWNLL